MNVEIKEVETKTIIERDPREKEITEMVDSIDLNQMTPLDAMMFLCELKKK